MFDFASEHLLWTTRGNSLPYDKLSEKGLTVDGYHVDVQSIKIHFGLWKCLHQTALSKGKPISHCTQIIPEAIAYWNKNKVFVDVMSRYLLHIKIPFRKANPILQLVVRNIMYMLVNGFLSTQWSTCDKKLFTDDSVSHVDIKAKLSKNNNLN